MSAKDKIILAALELAAEQGLNSVTMSQIADKVGIRKASLYSSFASKEDIITGIYGYLRQKAKERNDIGETDYTAFVKNKTLEEVLMISVGSYTSISTDKDMLAFYRIVYSQRSYDPKAAQIVAEETNCMITATKNLFCALKAFGKINCEDIDMTALSFCMTVHSIIDHQLDMAACGMGESEMMEKYIHWFCENFGTGDKAAE